MFLNAITLFEKMNWRMLYNFFIKTKEGNISLIIFLVLGIIGILLQTIENNK